jgi:hypothetical protein
MPKEAGRMLGAMDENLLMRYVLGAEALGALPNGTRFRKGKTNPGDIHPEGARGTICGSCGPFAHEGSPRVFAYLVAFDDTPSAYVFIHGGDGRIYPEFA